MLTQCIHVAPDGFQVPAQCRTGQGISGAGTGDIVEAVRHARTVLGEIRRLQLMPDEELMAYAKNIGAPYALVKETKELGRLPVVNFAAGGIATPADAALMMQIGVDGVFVGGCRLGDCNYITHGNYHALNLVLLAKRILAHIGVDPQRLRVEFMSGGEGNLFVDGVDAFIEQVKTLGPLGKTDGLDSAELGEKLSEVERLVPYIKIEKREKLTTRLENEAEYDDFFTRDEVDRLFGEVVSYHIDPEKCQACMICRRRCPVDAIDGGKNRIHVIDQDRCIKCGTCLDVCPSRFGAVSKIVGKPLPPPLPEEQRTLTRKVRA